MGQRGPEKAGEFARDRGDDLLLRFPAPGQTPIATVQPRLRVPGLLDDGCGCPPLTPLQRAPAKRVMPVVPRRFDEYPSQVCVPGLGNSTAACDVPLECSEGTRPVKAISRGAEGKRRASPSSAAIPYKPGSVFPCCLECWVRWVRWVSTRRPATTVRSANGRTACRRGGACRADAARNGKRSVDPPGRKPSYSTLTRSRICLRLRHQPASSAKR